MGTLYRVDANIGLNVRDAPNGNKIGALPNRALVEALSEETTADGGFNWLKIQARGRDLSGFAAIEFLQRMPDHQNGHEVSNIGANLTNEPNHQFTFEELRPAIEQASALHGVDHRVIAGILRQESSFKNWRVHHDGTGHGLVGLDDNGLLPDFENWCGQSFGRGHSASSIPPGLQIVYCAKTIAAYSAQLGSDINGARAWHRGQGLWHDERGAHYASLIRGHMVFLFGQG